ncbi:Terminase small subunit [compost metagenome]
MALTSKQQKFVDAKACGASNKEAAEAAGYAASTASAAGSRLAKEPKIVAALEMLKASGNVKAEPTAVRPAANHGETDDSAAGNDDESLSELPNTGDPLVWLLALMNEPKAKVFDRRNAAQAALPYVHGKKADQGKKDQKQQAAEQAGKSSRFGLRKGHLKAVT